MARHYRTYTPAELVTWIRKLRAEDNLHAFYICKAWLHLRAEVLREQHNECQICKQQGKFEPATTVHHIKTVRAFPWLALNKSNLMAVCDDCHYNIHHKNKPRWDDERW